jgi:hypothetical protein
LYGKALLFPENEKFKDKPKGHLGLPTRAPPKAPARLDAFLQTA